MKNQMYGKVALYAVFLVLTTVIFTLLRDIVAAGSILWFLKLCITIGILVYAMYSYKKEVTYLSYGDALWFGTLTSIFSSILIALCAFVYFKFFLPADLYAMLSEQIEAMLTQMNNSDTDVDSIMKNLPTYMFFTLLLFYSLLGFIYSLIIAIFVKQDKPFDSNEQVA